MTYQAQFLFPSCNAAGLSVGAQLRNGSRIGDRLGDDIRKQGLKLELAVYRDGEAVFHEPHFATIAHGDSLTLDASNVPPMASAEGSEYLVQAKCSLEGGDGYFAQEHQLSYASATAQTHLLYDQLPVPRPGGKSAPIVLLAPKAWVGAELNTYVAFASGGLGDSQSMELSLLDEGGARLHQETRDVPVNGTFILDVRSCLPRDYQQSSNPRFVNVVARGGAAYFAILAFVVNERSGGLALEHSLSPHYYVKVDRERLRRDALRFEEAP